MLLPTSDSPSLPDGATQNNAAGEPEYLSESSPKDRPWDRHRSEADRVASMYMNAPGWFHRLGERVEQCSQVLQFAWSLEKETPGALTLKLRNAYFCRVRHCPVCQWRRSLMWIARFLEGAPRLLAQHPSARFVFLTLTRKNIPVGELRNALREMSEGWGRLSKRKEFSAVLGWLRTVEVTRGRDATAHPHYHALLVVPADYFRNPEEYLTQAGWTTLWRDSLRLDYDPIVHVTAVKSKCAARSSGRPSKPLLNAARETLKYAVKPADMSADPDWFLELTRQLHNCRFIASGGILKNVLREHNEANEDLLLLREAKGEDEDGPRLYFNWWRPVRRYKRRPFAD